MRFVDERERISLRSITVAPKRPQFSTLDSHFITSEVSRRHSVLFDVPYTQEARMEEMIYMEASFRKLSVLPGKYQMLACLSIPYNRNLEDVLASQTKSSDGVFKA